MWVQIFEGNYLLNVSSDPHPFWPKQQYNFFTCSTREGLCGHSLEWMGLYWRPGEKKRGGKGDIERMKGGKGVTKQCVQCKNCSPAMMWQCWCPQVHPLHTLSLLPCIHRAASPVSISMQRLLSFLTSHTGRCVWGKVTTSCFNSNIIIWRTARSIFYASTYYLHRAGVQKRSFNMNIKVNSWVNSTFA